MTNFEIRAKNRIIGFLQEGKFATSLVHSHILRIWEERGCSKDIQRCSRPSTAHPFDVEKPVATQGKNIPYEQYRSKIFLAQAKKCKVRCFSVQFENFCYSFNGGKKRGMVVGV
jgi:hypothetical protein